MVVQAQPGDVVAFHAHLLNRAHGGAPRLSCTIDYLPWPGLARPRGGRAMSRAGLRGMSLGRGEAIVAGLIPPAER